MGRDPKPRCLTPESGAQHQELIRQRRLVHGLAGIPDPIAVLYGDDGMPATT